MSWKCRCSGPEAGELATVVPGRVLLREQFGDTPTLVGVRTTNAKLVKYPGHPEWTEVFDLTVDPYELKNLAGDPAAVARLSAEFDAQVKATAYAEPPGMDRPGEGKAGKKEAKKQ